MNGGEKIEAGLSEETRVEEEERIRSEDAMIFEKEKTVLLQKGNRKSTNSLYNLKLLHPSNLLHN